MKVKVYVNWNSAQIMGNEDVNAYISKLADEYNLDGDCFEDWLENNFTYSELWYMSDETRAEAEKQFKEECLEMAREDFENAWETREIEI